MAKGRKRSTKFDIYSWLPPRVTRSRAKKRTLENDLLNEANLINVEKPSPNSGQDQAQAPDPRPGPPAAPNPKVPRITPNRARTPPAQAAVRNLKTEKKSITEILNELYTNPDFPTV